MENKIFKPLYDKLFWIIWISTSVLMILVTVVSAFYPITLLFMIPIDLFTFYFLITPLFSYVELREESLFIKFGFILKREIPYSKIRGAVKERKIYSESVISLKNAIEHVAVRESN